MKTAFGRDVLDVNRETMASFVKKSREFLNLPFTLAKCDSKKCNPRLYEGRKGAAAVRRSKKVLPIIKRMQKDYTKLLKILEV